MKESKTKRSYQFLLLIVLPLLTHYFFPVKIVIHKPYSYLGIVVMFVGVFMAIRTSIFFRRAGNSFSLQGDSSKLITTGLFSYSRNPMYLGILFWLIGLAVLLGSLTAFIYPVIFFALANLMISYEEKQLENMYSKEYINYKNRVRRWF